MKYCRFRLGWINRSADTCTNCITRLFILSSMLPCTIRVSSSFRLQKSSLVLAETNQSSFSLRIRGVRMNGWTRGVGHGRLGTGSSLSRNCPFSCCFWHLESARFVHSNYVARHRRRAQAARRGPNPSPPLFDPFFIDMSTRTMISPSDLCDNIICNFTILETKLSPSYSVRRVLFSSTSNPYELFAVAPVAQPAPTLELTVSLLSRLRPLGVRFHCHPGPVTPFQDEVG